jgi:hypothetical protein
VISAHSEQYLGIATLSWEVDMVADVMVGGNGFEELFREVFGVGGGEPKPDIGEGFSSVFEKVLESVPWYISEFEHLRETL